MKFSRHNERCFEFGYVFEKIAQLRPKRILDIGSGLTSLPHSMAVCGCEVTAIDNIRDYWEVGVQNRHWKVIDDDILNPKLSGKFDLITCISVIEHIEDHQRAFANMVKFLAPNGRLLITTPYSENNPVPNVYKLAGAAYGQDEKYGCRSTSRKELDGWLGTGAKLEEQRFYRLWSGPVWTQGELLPFPHQVTREDQHQLSLMLFSALN